MQLIDVFAEVSGELVALVLDNANLWGNVLLTDICNRVRVVAVGILLGAMAHDWSETLSCPRRTTAAASTAYTAATGIASVTTISAGVAAKSTTNTATAPRWVAAITAVARAAATTVAVRGTVASAATSAA